MAKIEVRTVDRGCTPAEADAARIKLSQLKAVHDPDACAGGRRPFSGCFASAEVEDLWNEILRRMQEEVSAMLRRMDERAERAAAERARQQAEYEKFERARRRAADRARRDPVERARREAERARLAEERARAEAERRAYLKRQRAWRAEADRVMEETAAAAADRPKTPSDPDRARRAAEFASEGWSRGRRGQAKAVGGVVFEVWKVGGRWHGSRDGQPLARTFRTSIEARTALFEVLEQEPAPAG